MPHTATVPTPDTADQLAAGTDYPYPVRDFRDRVTHENAAALFTARRAWWLDAAAGYTRLAELALDHGDTAGCREALGDARRAREASNYYAPRGV